MEGKVVVVDVIDFQKSTICLCSYDLAVGSQSYNGWRGAGDCSSDED